MSNDALDVAGNVIGYIYTVAWGVSFLGQIYENWKLKNVEGCKLDYIVYNMTGFSFYAIYNTLGRFYQSQVNVGTVDWSDLIFAWWAIAMSTIQFIQCFFIYPRGANKVGDLCFILTGVIWGTVFIYCLLTNITHAFVPDQSWQTVNLMGYFKLLISFIKYMPPLYWNWKRQSTIGWSIFNILLDFTGGFFSFLQIILQSFEVNGNADIFNGTLNITKFGLSIISMFFDILFMIQHYILYNPKRRALQKQKQIAEEEQLFKPINKNLLEQSENDQSHSQQKQ